MRFDDNINALNEGLWDRTKARAAGAVGAVKGIGNQVAGGVKGAIAGATGNVAGATAAAQQGRQGAVSGQVAKINSYKATAQEKIKKLTNEIFSDLGKLGINVKANSNIANGFVGQLNKSFDQLTTSLQGAAPASATPSAKPPVLRSKSPAPVRAPAPTTAAPAPSTTVPTPASAPVATTPPSDDKAIIDDLNKNKNEILGDNGLIGKAKYVAGQKGLGGTGKSGVDLLKQGPSGDEGVEQARAELGKKYNVPPEKLVELLGQVFTESRKLNKKSIVRFDSLFKKI
jgi:hypothetical protein